MPSIFFPTFSVLSGPPQAVSVVQLDNSSTVRVSWEPPFADIQDEPILEYRVRAHYTLFTTVLHFAEQESFTE